MALSWKNLSLSNRIERILALLLSPATKKRNERIMLSIAITSYLIHLLLIILAKQGIIPAASSKLLKNPISAIYTPFSFILVYEVYLLLFYLPQSISFYIGKQYEIITLIVIRRIFKDLGNLELVPDWWQNDNDLQFTYDAVTSLLLFFLIYLFYHKILRRLKPGQEQVHIQKEATDDFILLKKCIAILLVPVLAILSVYSFSGWVIASFNQNLTGINTLSNINNIFFDEFFTILIVVDVLLLLASLFYSDEFHTIIRNSGFVLSTILIKLSFSVSGILNNALILGAVAFGLMVMLVHQWFERAAAGDKASA